MPVISICIPTYNRAECLRDCFDSILVAIQGFEDSVEIVVSDNASSDHTGDVIREYKGRFPCFLAHRNAVNIGGERNFRMVASLSSGNYVWVFGDDDKLDQSSIRAVFPFLARNVDLVLCNYSIWEKGFKNIIRPFGISVDMPKTLRDKSVLLKSFGSNIGYISTVIVKRSVFFCLADNEYEEFVEYGFPFMYAVYRGLPDAGDFVFIENPIVLNRAENSSGYDWYKYFVTGISLIFSRLLLYGYSGDSVRGAIASTLKKYVLRAILVSKKNKQFDQLLLRKLFDSYRTFPHFWLIIVPVYFCPAVFVEFAHVVKSSFAKRR